MTDAIMHDVEHPPNSLQSIGESIEENGKSENLLASQDVSLDAPPTPTVAKPEPKEHPSSPRGDEPSTKLRAQRAPLPANIREYKPPPRHVIVIAFGSYAIRYGFASDSTPKRLFPAVAFPRRKEVRDDEGKDALVVPMLQERTLKERERATDEFDDIVFDTVNALYLEVRRRGGGKPIPWKVEIEPVADEHSSDSKWMAEERAWAFDQGDQVIVGKDVQLLMRDKARASKYDIVFPMWDGKFSFDSGGTPSLVRRALDALIDHIVSDLEAHRKDFKPKLKLTDTKPDAKLDGEAHDAFMQNNPACATTFVTIVAPETSDRRDVAEMIDAIFRSKSLRCGAMFVHQSAVSCALGAGLATCAVVDIGHSATVVACIEDGIVCGESRIHLQYGSYHVQKAFAYLLRKHSKFYDSIGKEDEMLDVGTKAVVVEDAEWIVNKVCEQACGFNVDENDSMSVTLVKAPSGRSLRVKLGVGLRCIPAYGLIFPSLLKHVEDMQMTKTIVPERGAFEKNSEDDNFVGDIFNDLRRSGIATSALPIGLFANDAGQIGEQTCNSKEASVVDAIVWSIAKAIEVKRPDQQQRTPDYYRRYLNAIVLAGGGAQIEGIAQALEGRIKKGFLDVGLNIADVTVIDGGKGKGDEELAAAAAVLKDVDGGSSLVDDTDTASLPWKGGAVMVEADALNDYWVYRDDWDARNIRAMREKAPFYW